MALFCAYFVYLGVEQVTVGKQLLGHLTAAAGLIWASLLLITWKIQRVPDQAFAVVVSVLCLPLGFFAAIENGLLPMSILLCMPVVFYMINPIRSALVFTGSALGILSLGIHIHDPALLGSPMGMRMTASTIAITLGTHLSHCYFHALHRRLGNLLSAKDEFLRNLNHELRTPLHSLLSLTHLLKANAPNTPELQENLRSLGNLCHQMSELTNGVLTLAEAENKPELQEQCISPALTMRKLASMYGPMAAENGIRVEPYIHPRVPEWIEADPVKLKQILGNFITNAIKYGKSADIQLSVKPQAYDDLGQVESLRFAVIDCGAGMTETEVQNLFKPFKRQSAEYTANSSGLGLSISKSLTELMGGQVGVHSILGRGTTIWADLPCKHVENAEMMTEPQHYNGWQLSGSRLLIIEDDAMLLKLNCKILEQHGAHCTPTGDGQSALNVLETARPFDLILVDYQLPDFRGDLLIRKIKEQKPHKETPILLLSGGVMQQDLDLLNESGVHEILAKPIAPQNLVEKISNHINMKERETPPKRVSDISTTPPTQSAHL